MTQAPTPTADTVRRLVRSLLKDGTLGAADAGGPEIRPVAAGGEHSTWWVGTRHVLRLAPDRAASVRRRRELRLRDLVRAHLPVAVPTSVAHGEWVPGLAYTLDTKVPGGSAEEHDVSAVGEADLAGLLTGLREVPVRQAEALGVPRVAPRSLEALRREAGRAVERLARGRRVRPGPAPAAHLRGRGPARRAARQRGPRAPRPDRRTPRGQRRRPGARASSTGPPRSSATPPRTSRASPSPSAHPPPSAPPPSPVTAPAPACAASGSPAATPSSTSPRTGGPKGRRRACCGPASPRLGGDPAGTGDGAAGRRTTRRCRRLHLAFPPSSTRVEGRPSGRIVEA